MLWENFENFWISTRLSERALISPCVSAAPHFNPLCNSILSIWWCRDGMWSGRNINKLIIALIKFKWLFSSLWASENVYKSRALLSPSDYIVMIILLSIFDDDSSFTAHFQSHSFLFFLFMNVKAKTSQNSCLVRHINSLYRLFQHFSFLVYSSSASAHHITSQLTWHWWWQRNTIRKSERDMLVKAQKGISNYLCRSLLLR